MQKHELMPIYGVIVRLMTLNTDQNICMPFIPYITYRTCNYFNINLLISVSCLTSREWDSLMTRVGTYTFSHIY